MQVLLLRFDAPLMSFGGVVVDHINKTEPFPYRSMLAGLLANALGMTRRDEQAFMDLQSRIRYAARRDRRGEILIDYQTVDFGPNGSMQGELGWTTRGELEERKGGDASDGTHIRYRHYVADAIVTVALSLVPPEVAPRLRDVSEAIRRPARPLFLGRKCCVPSGPVWLGEMEAESLRAALETIPRAGPALRSGDRRAEHGELEAMWPVGVEDSATLQFPRVEDFDARNSVHVGRRLYSRGLVNPPEVQRGERET